MARASRTEGAPMSQDAEKTGNDADQQVKAAEASSDAKKDAEKPDFAEIAEGSGRTEGMVRAQHEMNETVQHAKGTPPKTGAEGGVIEDGTGDFDPDHGSVTIQDRESRRASAPPANQEPKELKAPEGYMVVVDSNGVQTIDEVGIDGKNPVSTQNPHPKAVRK